MRRSNDADPQLAARGTVEVTAELVEIPEGAIFKRDLYNYATILKYQVRQVHRGRCDGDFIYVGHYNPWKPRGEAADQRVPDIGGNLRQFRGGPDASHGLGSADRRLLHGRHCEQVLRAGDRAALLGRLDEPE